MNSKTRIRSSMQELELKKRQKEDAKRKQAEEKVNVTIVMVSP